MAASHWMSLENDPALQRRAQFARFGFAVRHGDERTWIQVSDGTFRFAPAGTLEALAPCDFTISAPAEAWARFSQAVPEPGYHDVIAMVECGHAAIEGDLLPFFRHLFLVKALLARRFGKEWQ